eukprot:6189737-Pleurochrysis_carterae.AAC.1
MHRGSKRGRPEDDPSAPWLLRDQPKGLPVGWVGCYDPTYKRTYYYDLAHDAAQWELPTEQSAIEAATVHAIGAEPLDVSKLPGVTAELLCDERRAYPQ